MQAQPFIAVRDIQKSSRWYQAVLGCEGGHGGSEYKQIVCKGRMVLQLHHWTHTNTRAWEIKTQKPYGAVLWFRDNEFDGAIERANTLNAERLEEPKMNPNANHREFWLRGPDGYVVVIAGSNGDLGAP